MAETEQDFHRQIDELQDQKVSAEDLLHDPDRKEREKFLGEGEVEDAVDDLQQKVKDLDTSDIRPEYRVQFLKDFYTYINTTEYSKLTIYLNSEIQGYLARLISLHHMESDGKKQKYVQGEGGTWTDSEGNPVQAGEAEEQGYNVREMMDEQRAMQDSMYEEEQQNDNEDKEEIDPAVREKINEIEEEFGIDIRGATEELTLDGAETLHENLRLVRSMPEFVDAFEVIPYIQLKGVNEVKDEENTKESASMSADNFHLTFSLWERGCFSFQTVIHEVGHTKDFIYKLANPGKKDEKIPEEKPEEVEKEKLVMTKEEFINLLELDETNNIDGMLIDFLKEIPMEEWRTIIRFISHPNNDKMKLILFLFVTMRPSIQENKSLNSNHIRDVFLDTKEMVEALNNFDDPGVISLSKIEQVSRNMLDSGFSIDDISRLPKNALLNLIKILSIKYLNNEEMRTILPEYIRDPQSGTNELYSLITQKTGLNILFEKTDQLSIMQNPALLKRFNDAVFFDGNDLYFNNYSNSIGVGYGIIKKERFIEISKEERGIGGGGPNIKYFSDEETRELRQSILSQDKLPKKVSIPSEYERYSETSSREEYLQQGITRKYATREYPDAISKALQDIEKSKKVSELLTFSPELSVSFKTNVETVLAAMEGRGISKERITGKSAGEFLEELETLLSNPNTSFENVSQIVLAPEERDELKQMGQELAGKMSGGAITPEQAEFAINTLSKARSIQKLFGDIPVVSGLLKGYTEGMEISDLHKDLIAFAIDFAMYPEKCTMGRLQEITGEFYVKGKEVGQRSELQLEADTTFLEWAYVKDENGNIILRPELEKYLDDPRFAKIKARHRRNVERGLVRDFSKRQKRST